MAPASARPRPEAHHIYSVGELLAMQVAPPLSISGVEKLNQHPEISCLLKVPEHAIKRQRSIPNRMINLVDITNRRHNRQQSTMYNSEASAGAVESREVLAPSTTTNNNDTQSRQWFLQRRDSSDDSPQPHSAPASSIAQQSENFQRFYQAVVSPTHVRVTAGGKIVRNTRSPAYEWNSDKHHFEPLHQPQPAADLNAQPPSWHQNVTTDRGSFDSQNSGVSAQAIKISPPTQFDQTKPFMYNGQLVYPVPPPPNGLPVPMAMIGNPNFIAQNPVAPIGGFTHGPHFPIPVPMFPHGQPVPMHMPHVPTGSETMHPMAPFAPPLMQMPVLSELTKRHIQVLQEQLRILDSQPGGNHSSQQAVQMQRNMVLAGIKQMEAMLEAQLAQEALSKTEAHSEPKLLLTAAAHESPKSQSTSEHQKSTVDSAYSSFEKPIEKQGGEKKPSTRTDSMSKSKLSAAAAMAPPFQPRSHIVSQQVPVVRKAHSLRSAMSVESLAGEARRNIDPQLLSSPSNPWTVKSTPSSGLPLVAPPRVLKSESMREPKIQTRQPPPMQRSNTFHGKMDFHQPDLKHGNRQAIPYLVGVIPGGTPLASATHQDLVYPRELNEHELQARQLYWGKAPKSVSKGLPKFDGKDFYPPSPVKESIRMAAVNIGAETPIHDFASLFTESGVNGYRPTSPVRYQAGHTTSGPTQAPNLPYNSSLVDPVNYYEPQGSQVLTAPSISGLDTAFENFSGLFMERGVAGFQSSQPKEESSTKTLPTAEKETKENFVTSKSFDVGNESDGAENGTPTTDSFGMVTESFGILTSNGSSTSADDRAALATVEEEENNPSAETSPTITQKQVTSQKLDLDGTFEERVAKFALPENQTLFLQNMLSKSTAMTGSAVSGKVSSATATGYLPLYRGTAMASLAPTFSNASSERDTETTVKPQFSRDNTFSSVGGSGSNGSESIEDLTSAEGYMRYLAQKRPDSKKFAEQTLTPDPLTGPVMGSDW
ncbi:hypothetical protein HYFRA_00002662 [Hymenoscyphus fraxineus]|uniref:Uncharacterized protein n=1 Tax=Hymenoscyphus fraxineus TaxID=746836 RepID=A0A9N9L8N4_9HELO|nr:hypothetical protein HYFRA_00002662 [Hymenoscyphus fraxineus]